MASWAGVGSLIFLSTLSLRRATLQFGYSWQSTSISIHALLAESDHTAPKSRWSTGSFLSTLSLRRATVLENVLAAVREFLSTFSLRRATLELKPISNFGLISIHALLAESDAALSGGTLSDVDFYPRSPCGERPV